MKAPLIDIKEILGSYSVTPKKTTFWVSKGLFQAPDFEVKTQLFRAGFHLVGLCLSGTLKVRVNFRDYTIKKNSFMAITPTTIVQVLSKSKDFRVRALLFDKDFLLQQSNNTRLLDNLGFFENNGVTSFSTTREQTETLIPVYELIRMKYDSDEIYKDDIARSLIFSLLYQCAEFHAKQAKKQDTKASRKSEIKATFLQLVKKHCKRERKLNFYAEKLYISPKHLMETIKDETGKTAGEIIDEAVILEAKLLLNDKDKSIQKIADELHFPNQTFFTKFFKRHTQETPSAWRNKN
ncbi:MAG TPA: helix-turn-helix domain-containing protein [Chitinophagales bacterium]